MVVHFRTTTQESIPTPEYDVYKPKGIAIYFSQEPISGHPQLRRVGHRPQGCGCSYYIFSHSVHQCDINLCRCYFSQIETKANQEMKFN